MIKRNTLQLQIFKLKRHLEVTARKNQYNFIHPEVVSASQDLDKLIVRAMKVK
ncbi:aspartyl-phosphate phosphatase Spo0E family protein [Marinicrinis lubricantis]|uniref:Aspartyl-phosphate phosphatase Spo0E family protein n=1 Tax=Marinicrinis lubricantis TaxID=2086470 RepID=A0ABW1INK4_9BACL